MGYLDNFFTLNEFQKLAERFPCNPIVQFIATNNFDMFLREFNHLNFWINLIPENTPGLKNFINSLYRSKIEYQHSRLGLMIAARLLKHDSNWQIKFDPPIDSGKRPDLKIIQLSNEPSNSIYFELTGRYEFEIMNELIALCLELHKFANKHNRLLRITVNLNTQPIQATEISKLKSYLIHLLSQNNFSIQSNSKIGIFIINPSIESISEIVFSPMSENQSYFDKEIIRKYLINSLRKKKSQLPKNKPSLIIMDISDLGTLKDNLILHDTIDDSFLSSILEQVFSQNLPEFIGVMLFDISNKIGFNDCNSVLTQVNPNSTVNVFNQECEVFLSNLTMILQGEIQIPQLKANKSSLKEKFNELRKIRFPKFKEQKIIIHTIFPK